MSNDRELMTDQELDQLLAHASTPPVSDAARLRLMQRVSGDSRPAAVSNVISFSKARGLRAKPAPQPRLGWLAGLPLAASLALGIYLGTGGTFDGYLPSSAYDLIAGNSSSENILTGIEDVESYTEDGLS